MDSHQHINGHSGKVDWMTPGYIVEAARRAMGGIDLDPASTLLANETVKATRIYTREDDGLTNDWIGRVWLNHPYARGQNNLWIDKLINEYKSGNTVEVCAITWSSTSEQWFKPLLEYPQCFLYGRVAFLDEEGKPVRGTTKGSVITYLGADTLAFCDAFSDLGAIKVLV